MWPKMKKGTNRYVFLFPSLGVVVKVPLIQVRTAFLSLKLIVQGRELARLRNEWKRPVEDGLGIRGLLCLGFVANWSEYLFSRETQNPFLQPTYVSFLGLLNIQKFEESDEITDWQSIWSQLLDLTERQVLIDSHHFTNPFNFCLKNGRLVMVDYGGKKCREVIARWGEKIHREFDPSK